RAPQGANKQRIIEAVLSDPGITATEIAERTGVKRTVVSATINRLKRNGELEPVGQGVRVPLAGAAGEPLAAAVSQALLGQGSGAAGDLVDRALGLAPGQERRPGGGDGNALVGGTPALAV